MSKKNLVKKIIDDLVMEGRDFADLTQSALTKMEGLEGVSKTTIKRAKKEYKQEKVINRQDYREQSIKRKIYKYLDRKPKSTLSDLREAMPDIPPAKVSEYHRYWKKKQEKAQHQGPVKSPGISPRKLKEMVFMYLDNNSTATVETLYQQFPDAKQSSVYSYFSGWKRKQKNTEKVKKGGLFEVIFKFLNRKPESTIDEIKAAFSDVPIKSIEIYHNLWLKELEDRKTNAVSIDDVVQEFIGLNTVADSQKAVEQDDGLVAQRHTGKENRIADAEMPKKRRGRPPRVPVEMKSSARVGSKMAAGRSQKTDNGPVAAEIRLLEKNVKTSDKSNNEAKLIQRLRQTIETYQTTILELEKEHQRLKQRQSGIFNELKTMRADQIQDVRDFVLTYLKGLHKT